MIDCSTFHDCEIDALYGELDDEAAAGMSAHTATCTACAARLEKLRSTRGLVRSVAVEDVPTDFESRIMAAVDAGLARRAAPPVVALVSAAGARGPAASSAPAPTGPAPTGPAPVGTAPVGTAPVGTAKEGGGATIFRFIARPSFAVAAGFVLVIGAAAVLMMQSGASKSPMAMSDEAPAAVARGAAPGAPPAAAPLGTATAAASVAVADESAAATGAGGAPASAVAMATAEPPSPPAAAPPPPAAPMALAAKAAAGPAAKPAAVSAATPDPLAAAKALYAAGRYAEALPKFEALKATSPEAELYAARCVARTRGCAAAEPRFAAAAQTNSGTALGGEAQLESANCVAELDAKPGAGAGATGGHASPKKPSARPADPAASPPAKR